MYRHIGFAKVFDNEDDAIKALSNGKIMKSDVIACNPELACSTAVITDGRYSGCTRGPAIGYVSPEALVT
jgi:dihydroxy-acid dehydratase